MDNTKEQIIITAKEAYEMTHKQICSEHNKFVSRIFTEIRKAIQQGKYRLDNIFFSQPVPDSIVSYFNNLGYIVEYGTIYDRDGFIKDRKTLTISWENGNKN